MKVKTITYGTSVNKGNEWQRLEISVEVDEGEKSRDVFNIVRYQVNNLLGIDQPDFEEPEEAPEPEPEPEPVKAVKPKAPAKAVRTPDGEVSDPDIPW